MRVWIVEDQDTGDNAATVEAVFTSREAAEQWMVDHEGKAFGYYTLAAPLGWDGDYDNAYWEVNP